MWRERRSVALWKKSAPVDAPVDADDVDATSGKSTRRRLCASVVALCASSVRSL
jgi:hypothetical protein